MLSLVQSQPREDCPIPINYVKTVETTVFQEEAKNILRLSILKISMFRDNFNSLFVSCREMNVWLAVANLSNDTSINKAVD